MSAELVRLYRALALNAFRGTLAGTLLVGWVFAPINIVVYVGGIPAAADLHQLICDRTYVS